MIRHIAPALLAVCALAAPVPAAAPDLPLEGTFRLVSATRTILETGEVEQSFGDNPSGYIVYGKDRRMMVLIVTGDRPRPSFKSITDQDRTRLFETMAAYAGSYSFDGKVIRHFIDTSWNGVLTGTTQIRQVRIDGDRLIYTTEASPAPTDGRISTSMLVWQRVPPPGGTGK